MQITDFADLEEKQWYHYPHADPGDEKLTYRFDNLNRKEIQQVHYDGLSVTLSRGEVEELIASGSIQHGKP